MSEHNKALVPIESWAYNSPEIRFKGDIIDIGLFAEALIYYDQILLNITNETQFAQFLMWFINQNQYSDLLSLIDDDTLTLYDYSFMTTAIRDDRVNRYIIMNIQDPTQEKPNTFEQRFLYHPSVAACFKSSREKSRLYKTLRGKVIEKKASEFSASIDNARLDYLDPRRNTLLLQSLVDEVYPLLGLGKSPEIFVTLENLGNTNKASYNLDFVKLREMLGPNLNFHPGTPLTGVAHCNRLIWSAAQEKCDLYLGNPMANLVGDKLFESHLKSTKIKRTIEELNQEVEFPNIRKLVNEGKIGLREVLQIRKKAKKFRSWLQTESDRDRNAIIAYHNETGKELGISSLGKKSLRMFGILGLTLAQTYITYNYTDLQTALITSGATAFLLDVASKMEEDWKPVVFGNWVSEKIKATLKDK